MENSVKSKRILIVTSTFPRWSKDQMPTFILELARTLAGSHEVHVLAPHYPKAKLIEEMEGVKVYRFVYAPAFLEKLAYGAGLLNNLKAKPWLALVLPSFAFAQLFWGLILSWRYKYSVVNAHWFVPSGAICALMTFVSRQRLVISSHGTDFHLLRNHPLLKLCCNSAKGLSVVSSALKNELVSKLNITPEKVHILPMGIDTKRFNLQKKPRSVSNMSLIFVGRLVPKKGVEILLHALSIVAKSGRSISCSIAGDGPERTRLQVLAIELGLDFVSFLGHVESDRLPEVLVQHDLFVGPSIIAESGDREGLPVAFMEAMAAELALIVSKFEGIEDLLIDRQNALLVSPGDAKALAEAIIELSANQNLLQRLAENAKSTVKSYDWSNLATRFENVLLPS